MCKALSHEIVIDGLHLVGKTGGRRDVHEGRVAP
jgi:cyclic pyranopterin phosphate synthase